MKEDKKKLNCANCNKEINRKLNYRLGGEKNE